MTCFLIGLHFHQCRFATIDNWQEYAKAAKAVNDETNLKIFQSLCMWCKLSFSSYLFQDWKGCHLLFRKKYFPYLRKIFIFFRKFGNFFSSISENENSVAVIYYQSSFDFWFNVACLLRHISRIFYQCCSQFVNWKSKWSQSIFNWYNQWGNGHSNQGRTNEFNRFWASQLVPIISAHLRLFAWEI